MPTSRPAPEVRTGTAGQLGRNGSERGPRALQGRSRQGPRPLARQRDRRGHEYRTCSTRSSFPVAAAPRSPPRPAIRPCSCPSGPYQCRDPAGFNARPSPYGVAFTGGACSEPRLIELAYAFEQARRQIAQRDGCVHVPERIGSDVDVQITGCPPNILVAHDPSMRTSPARIRKCRSDHPGISMVKRARLVGCAAGGGLRGRRITDGLKTALI